MTNTGPSIGRQILEKEVLGQSSGRSASWQGLWQILSLIIAFALGMISSVVVDGCRLSARRAAMSDCLLTHVRYCCIQADGRSKVLADSGEKFLKQPDLILKYIYYPIDTSFWEACLSDLGSLPSENLQRLVSFYGFVFVLNLKLQAITENQQAYADQDKSGQFNGEEGANRRDVLEKLIENKIDVAVRMCDELAERAHISSLAELPQLWPRDFPGPPPAGNAAAPPADLGHPDR